jgi:hypothetical protein
VLKKRGIISLFLFLKYLYVMKLLESLKNLLVEEIPPFATPIHTERYYTIDIEWYVSDHAVRRTKRKENIEEMTMEEIEDMCEKATDELIGLFTDKTIRINPHTGFHFQIRNIENYYATLGCMIVSYVPMEQIEIVVKTTTKSGKSLGYDRESAGKQFVIDVI